MVIIDSTGLHAVPFPIQPSVQVLGSSSTVPILLHMQQLTNFESSYPTMVSYPRLQFQVPSGFQPAGIILQ